MTAAAPDSVRLPLEQERTILFAALADLGAADQALLELQPAHFGRLEHGLIFGAMQRVRARQEPITYQTVRWELQQRGELERIDPVYLLRLETDGMRGLDVAPAIRAVREAWEAREYEKVGAHLVGLARDGATPIDRVRAFAAESLARLTALQLSIDARLPDHVAHISEVCDEVLARLEAGPPDFIDTPWPALTGMLGGGFDAGELVFLGARPGLGKTAMALEIAKRSARRGRPAFIVSREMLRVAIGLRLVAQEGPVDALALRKGFLTVDQRRTVATAIDRLRELPLYITDAPLRVRDINQIVGILRGEGPLGLVVVDYLQLVEADPEIRERRHQVEAVSAGLRALTNRHQVALLCLSSLSRPPEGKRPTLGSLRESATLEHDADTVLLLHRQDEMVPRTECIVAKARHGRPGVVELYLRGEFQRFEEQIAGLPRTDENE